MAPEDRMDERPEGGFSEVPDEQASRAPIRSRPAYDRARDVDFGSIFSMAWAVFTRQIVAVLAISLSTMAVVGVVHWFLVGQIDLAALDDSGSDLHDAETSKAGYITGFHQLLLWVAPLVMQGAVTWITVRHLQGARVTIGEALGVGFRRLLPVLGVVLVLGLTLVLIMLPAILAILAENIFFMLVATLVGLIVMLIAYIAWWVAVPVCIVERPGVMASIQRSFALTKGSRLWIFIVLVVLVVLQAISSGTYMAMTGGLDDLLRARPSAQFEFRAAPYAIGAIFGGFGAVCAAVGYYQFRTAKEGFGEEDLARIFD